MELVRKLVVCCVIGTLISSMALAGNGAGDFDQSKAACAGTIGNAGESGVKSFPSIQPYELEALRILGEIASLEIVFTNVDPSVPSDIVEASKSETIGQLLMLFQNPASADALNRLRELGWVNDEVITPSGLAFLNVTTDWDARSIKSFLPRRWAIVAKLGELGRDRVSHEELWLALNPNPRPGLWQNLLAPVKRAMGMARLKEDLRVLEALRLVQLHRSFLEREWSNGDPAEQGRQEHLSNVILVTLTPAGRAIAQTSLP